MQVLYMPSDARAHVPLVYQDEVGRNVGAPLGGKATSSDEAIGTAEVSSDDKVLTITPVAEEGTFVVTFRDEDLVAELQVVLQKPMPKVAQLNVADVSYETYDRPEPKHAPATPSSSEDSKAPDAPTLGKSADNAADAGKPATDAYGNPVPQPVTRPASELQTLSPGAGGAPPSGSIANTAQQTGATG